MSNEKKESKIAIIGEGKKHSILPTYLGMAGIVPIIAPDVSLNRLIGKEVIKPKRKCALQECSKLFTPQGNECCCSKEHFIQLKEKHKLDK